MKCRRCQGLMAEDQFFDFKGIQGFMWMRECMRWHCGYAANPLREANRHLNDAAVGA